MNTNLAIFALLGGFLILVIPSVAPGGSKNSAVELRAVLHVVLERYF